MPRVYKKRVYKKKAPKKSIKKVVKSYVKRELSKNLETKCGEYYLTKYVVSSEQPVSWNLLYFAMTQGSSEHQFIGNQVDLRSIRIDYSVDNWITTDSSVGFCNNPVFVEIAVVMAKSFKTATSLTKAELTQTGNINATADVHNYDPDKVTVLGRRRILLQSSNTSGYNTTANLNTGNAVKRVGKMFIKVNKKLRFRDFSTSYELSGRNLYFLAWSNTPDYSAGTGVAGCGRITANMRLYYKDA